jgi:hypothetical protein
MVKLKLLAVAAADWQQAGTALKISAAKASSIAAPTWRRSRCSFEEPGERFSSILGSMGGEAQVNRHHFRRTLIC